MEVTGLASVDWSAPWLAPFAGLGQTVAASSDWRKSLNYAAAAANVRNFNDQHIIFCEPDVAADEPYEAGIARTGRVPTRSNLHDFFNALIFLHFPRAKAQLNRLQSAAIARDGVRAVRGSVRDAATLIDENAVLIVTDRADIIESLRGHDWAILFQSRRAAWTKEINVVAFGHALLAEVDESVQSHHCACAPYCASAELAVTRRRSLDGHGARSATVSVPSDAIASAWNSRLVGAKREPGLLLRPRSVPSG